MLLALLRKKPVLWIAFSSRHWGPRIVGRGTILAKQVFGDSIYALVGTLGGKHSCHQELKWICERQRAGGIGIFAAEQANNVGGVFFGIGRALALTGLLPLRTAAFLILLISAILKCQA